MRLGNTTASTDDANVFYERSLGAITNTGYRLTSASEPKLAATYDAAGYMSSMTVSRPGAKCGNATTDCPVQSYSYEWDEVGRLTKATRYDGAALGAELTYAYDASDQRVRKSAGPRHTIYVFGSLELRSAEFTNGAYHVDDSTEVPYLFGHGVRLARVTYTDAAEFQTERRRIFLELGDHLGSTSVVLDRATGELVERSTAYAYGAAESNYRTQRWDHFREDYRFTGKEDDIEVGLIYFGARYLNPQLGRWISADPLAVHAPGEADLNLYAYVSGRAVVAVDPVGLNEETQTSDQNLDYDLPNVAGGTGNANAGTSCQSNCQQSVSPPATGQPARAKPAPAPSNMPTVKQGTGGLPSGVSVFVNNRTGASQIERTVDIDAKNAANPLAGKMVEDSGIDRYDVVEAGPDYGKSDAERHLEAQLALRQSDVQERTIGTDPRASALTLPKEIYRGGRLGTPETRKQNYDIGTYWESNRYVVTGGAGRKPEEHIKGPGGGNKGGTFVDNTVESLDGTDTVRIQTVTTRGRSSVPTQSEMRAAGRILKAFRNDGLFLIPKRK